MISFCSHCNLRAVKPVGAGPRFRKRNQGLVAIPVMQTPQQSAAILSQGRKTQNYLYFFNTLRKV